jgi:hypothetical protein
VGLRAFAAGLLLAGSISGCTMNPLAPDRPRMAATIGGERFSLVVARTDAEVARGLMGVASMPADQGMWFELDPNDAPPAF